MTHIKKRIRENWCPNDNDCGFWERLVGCDIADCTQTSSTCAIQSTQQGKAPNMERLNTLLKHLEGGVNSCIDTSGCSGDQLMGSLTPSFFPGDGRGIGFHPEQMTNAHPQCTSYGRVVVDRGTYGGPGTSTFETVSAGHLPLSLADHCYLLHDLMYDIVTPDNDNNIRIHADLVLLHNLKHVTDNLGESDFNISTAQTAFCLTEPNGIAGGTWNMGIRAQALSGLIGLTLDEKRLIWSPSGKVQNQPHLDIIMNCVKAMKIAVQNKVGVISSFGFFEDMEVGGDLTLWRSRPDSDSLYKTYGGRPEYFALEYFTPSTGYKTNFLDNLFKWLNRFTNRTTGKWNTLKTDCM